MRKKLLSLVLAIVLCLSLLPVTALAADDLSPESVYQAMIALKSDYPEGMRWTNDNVYIWHGNNTIGYGCVGFAFMLSDAAFGSLPARQITQFSFSDVRTGDILRINNNTHSVIVLEVRENEVVIAEGNYNSSIHWGRTLSAQKVESADYMLTRYPKSEENTPSTPTPANTAYASTQGVKVDSKTVEFQAYALKDANGNDTNYIKLRDVAYVLNGTGAQFSVGWDGATSTITVNSGERYQSIGSEMSTPFSGNRAYTVSTSKLMINGKIVDVEAILLKDDNGAGYTYFKLRDLGKALNFNVSWVGGTGIVINTDEPYSDAN